MTRRRLVTTGDLTIQVDPVDRSEIYHVDDMGRERFRSPDSDDLDFTRLQARLAAMTTSENTRRGYLRWIGSWWCLCQQRDRDLTDWPLWRGFLDALVRDRIAYLDGMAASKGRRRLPRGREPGIGYSGLLQAVAATSVMCACIGKASPTADHATTAYIKGLRVRLDSPVQRGTAVIADGILAALRALDVWAKSAPPARAHLVAMRDRALILVGFHAALRRSELTSLHIEDISIDARGRTAILTLRGTKTTGRFGVREVPIYAGSDPELNPIQAIRDQIAALDGAATGPLFRPIHRCGSVHPRQMNDREVARILQQRIGVAGFTAHGLRSGYVTQARIMGKANHEIRRVTGHASDDMIDVYDHHVNLIAQGPGNVVGATFGGGRLVDSEAGAGRRLVPDGRPTRRHRGVL